MTKLEQFCREFSRRCRTSNVHERRIGGAPGRFATPRRAPFMLALALVSAVACSGENTADGGGDSGGDGDDDFAPYVDVTVDVTGAVTTTGTYETRRYEYTVKTSCADVANLGSGGGGYGPEGGWQLPWPYFDKLSDGRPFSVQLEIDDGDFTGPGTYPGEDLRFGYVDFDGQFKGVQYEIDDLQTTTSLEFDAGMNGVWTFTDLVADDDSGTISGSIAWTCSD